MNKAKYKLKKIIVLMLAVIMIVGSVTPVSAAAKATPKKVKGQWVLMSGKKIAKKSGLYKTKSGWLAFKNGKFTKWTGVVQRPDNKVWYYTKNGKYTKKYTGLAKSIKNNKWYYVSKGKLNWKYTGLVKYGKKYYAVKKGARSYASGLSQNKKDGKWYYCKKGVYNKSFTGIASKIHGDTAKKEYYVKNGQVAWHYSGTISYGGYNYKISKGVVVGKYKPQPQKPAATPAPSKPTNSGGASGSTGTSTGGSSSPVSTPTPTPMITDIAKATITGINASYPFTGNVIRPVPTVVLNGKELPNNRTCYTVSYKNNVDPGTATITIKGIGTYTGSIQKTFKIEGSQPVAKEPEYNYTGFTVENRLPIYDFSYPSFPGIQQSVVQEAMEWYEDDQNRPIIKIATNNKDCDSLEFFNTSVNNEKIKHMTDYHVGRGYSERQFADINYASMDSDAECVLKNGGMLIPLTITKDNVKAGANKIAVYEKKSGAKVGEFTINIKSRAAAYKAYLVDLIEKSKGYKASSVAVPGRITKNKDLYKQLAQTASYLKDHTEYQASVETSFGNMPIHTLAKYGSIIDNGYGGCERSNILMALAAMQLGVEAKAKHVSVSYGSSGVHAMTFVTNPNSVFGTTSDVTFDATAHATIWSGMSYTKKPDYFNTLTMLF